MNNPVSVAKKAQCLYISHGGGPMPLLNEPSHRAMNQFFKGLPHMFNQKVPGFWPPKAILVVSAHWEEEVPTLLNNPSAGLLYDYYGFPEQTYHLDYKIPFASDIAKKLETLIEGQNTNRGYDHGVFIPLMMMAPKADIPVVQVSLMRNLSAKAHLELGLALKPLMEEPILIIGSGFSFHNLRHFNLSSHAIDQIDEKNDAFQDWLIGLMGSGEGEVHRSQGLLAWDQAPHARYCHPREEHLLPLHVLYGMAGSQAQCVFDDHVGGKRSTMFLFTEHDHARL